MKVRLPYQVAMCAWIDLLGYGSAISKAEFNPLRPEAITAVKRLRRFHRIVAESSLRRFPTLVMNDGAAAYRDLSWRTRWPTFEFVSDAYRLFRAINAAELKDGLPGARMVVACGFRLRGRRDGADARRHHFNKIIQEFSLGRITIEEAIGKAGGYRDAFDIIPALQANFAFTKAYLAEQSGRAGGLGGPKCYIDLALFDDPVPSWLDIGAPFDWKHGDLALAATFASLESLPEAQEVMIIDGTKISGGPEGTRDAIQTAQHLTDDPTVLAQVRDVHRAGIVY